ncbi:MAG: MFS transporter [Oscillospiraceae bacterium]|nr:MFS transporter [Oscillospiraceae bacterium]
MKEKIFSRNYCAAFFAQFCLGMVMYMLMSTLTEYATAFGATVFLAGVVSGMYAVGGIFSRLWSSGALGRFGWKKVALCTAALHLLACCCYFFVGSLPLLIILRFIHGLGFGATNNVMFTVSTSTYPKSRYAEATGYFTLSSILPVALGPFLGKWILNAFGHSGCFSAACVLSCLTLLFISLVTVPADTFGEPTGAARMLRGVNRLLDVKSLPVACCVGLMTIGYVAVMDYSAEYAPTVGLEAIFSCFYLIYAAVVILVRPIAGKLQDRRGDNIVCYPGAFTQAIGLFLVAWKPCALTVVLCAIGCALGYGTLNSCYNAIICSHVNPRRRSYAVASFFLLCDVGLGFGQMILGSVATLCGENYRVIYYAGAVLSLLTFVLYYCVWGRKGDTAHWIADASDAVKQST